MFLRNFGNNSKKRKKFGGSKQNLSYNLEIQKNNDIWAIGCIISEIYNVTKELTFPPYIGNKWIEKDLIKYLTKSWSDKDFKYNFKSLFNIKSSSIDEDCGRLYKYLGHKLLVLDQSNLNSIINELKPIGDIDTKVKSDFKMEKIEQILK